MHRLKIDRAFVRDLETDADDAVIVRMIIQLGHEMGLAVTAEGVETPAQAALLRGLGCDQMQGYLHGPAVAGPDFIHQFLPMADRERVPAG